MSTGGAGDLSSVARRGRPGGRPAGLTAFAGAAGCTAALTGAAGWAAALAGAAGGNTALAGAPGRGSKPRCFDDAFLMAAFICALATMAFSLAWLAARVANIFSTCRRFSSDTIVL